MKKIQMSLLTFRFSFESVKVAFGSVIWHIAAVTFDDGWFTVGIPIDAEYSVSDSQNYFSPEIRRKRRKYAMASMCRFEKKTMSAIIG